MAQKVATACKMKLQRDNLPRPNCDSGGKANNKRQAFINTNTRRFKIQTGDMPPPPGRASLLLTQNSQHAQNHAISRVFCRAGVQVSSRCLAKKNKGLTKTNLKNMARTMQKLQHIYDRSMAPNT